MRKSLFNICFVLNCLLVFLLFFENRFAVPGWLQVAGRAHPLLVHFPIVLLLLYAFMIFVPVSKKIRSDSAYEIMSEILLLLGALSSAVAALIGLFLSREAGYEAESLQWHKWGGVVLSGLSLGWYGFRKQIHTVKAIYYSASIMIIGLTVITGHQGASVTHGQDFLIAPIAENTKPAVSFNEAIVFRDMVKPIIDEKCLSCHNSKKAKGELVMETEELLVRGGKTGQLWDTTAADYGLMLKRIHLPLEQKKHMPPKGKTQLTDEELEIITEWVKKGSNFNLKASDLPLDDTLRLIAAKTFNDKETLAYDFEPAEPSDIQKLNTLNRAVAPQSLNSPALVVSFFNSRLFSVDQLKELSRIKKQITSLDLRKMPVKDTDVQIISTFENLHTLNLAFTGITGASLPQLKKLKFLKVLSLSGTQVNGKQLEQLRDFPNLKTVFIWNIPIDTTVLKLVQKDLKNIQFQAGYRGDTAILKLSPPLLENDEKIITGSVPLKLRHYLQGVSIRYTLDGSDPDSINAAEFKPGKEIAGNVVVRAKAFKPGWMGSDILEAQFLKQTYRPDTVRLLTPADSNYSGSSRLLTDMDKGTTNFREGNWLAWRRKRMELLLEYKQPVIVQSVALSSMIDVRSFIMPPLKLEIWGGDDKENLKLLGQITPEQPDPSKKDIYKNASPFLKAFECKFKASRVTYLKVIGTVVSKLPKWHPNKGENGYIFVDEILVN